VKIDVAGREEGKIETIISGFKDLPVRAIATSVNTPEDFDLCSRLGFELFLGEFFRKPSVFTRSSISPNHALLLDLSARTARDDDIRTIEEIFKKNPDLTFGLFNLVRSAYFHTSSDGTSIKQAITLLGYKNLQKWAALMLFTINHSDPSSNPLFENVLVRAATMELAASKLRRKGLSDAAYMTGIFSLVPALFDVRMEEMVEKANFGEEIREALLEGAGSLGAMLNVVEQLERGAYEKCTNQVEEAGIDLEHFLSAQASAFAECSALTVPRDGDAVDREPAPHPFEQKKLPSHDMVRREAVPKASWFKRVHAFFRHP
jgi:EAL and modified HD-GYP domain-containing signal transduction protein